MSKISLSLEQNEWDHLIKDSGLWGSTSKEIVKKIEKQLQEKMSRSNPSKQPEASVLSPLEFTGVYGKTFCVSSKEREPIEQLLPTLGGNILIFTSWTPNESGIEIARKKGYDKKVVIKKIQGIVQVQILLKRPDILQGFDHIIVDRIDEIDNKKDKKSKAAQIKAMLSLIPSLLKDQNLFVTTMLGIPILYEMVDEHKVV